MKISSKKLIIFCSEYLVIALLILALILALEQNSLYEGVYILVVGSLVLGLSLVCKEVLKRVIRKERPSSDIKLFIPGDRYAFPSGHATGVASVTVFFSMINTEIGSISLIISLIVIVARVKAHVHDLYDMAGGIILGVLTSYFFVGPVAIFVESMFMHFFD